MTRPPPFRIVVQPWTRAVPGYRADLLRRYVIYATGFAPTPDGALFTLQEALVGGPFKGRHVGAEVLFDWRGRREEAE